MNYTELDVLPYEIYILFLSLWLIWRFYLVSVGGLWPSGRVVRLIVACLARDLCVVVYHHPKVDVKNLVWVLVGNLGTSSFYRKKKLTAARVFLKYIWNFCFQSDLMPLFPSVVSSKVFPSCMDCLRQRGINICNLTKPAILCDLIFVMQWKKKRMRRLKRKRRKMRQRSK